MQNVSPYITSSNIFVTTLYADQQGQKRVGWTTVKFVGLHVKLKHIFLVKLKFVGRMQKKKKKTRFNTITGIADTSLITSAVITGGIFTSTAFTRGIGLLVGAAFSRAGGLLSLATVIRRKSFKIFAVKQKKYDAIKDGDISPTEFHKALQE